MTHKFDKNGLVVPQSKKLASKDSTNKLFWVILINQKKKQLNIRYSTNIRVNKFC